VSPCHHGIARPRVADGGDGLHICGVATNIPNNQSRTDDKGWSSSLGIGRGATNPSPQKDQLVMMCYTDPRNLMGSCEHGNELSGSMEGTEFLS
jgi:hypothetical protein